VAKAKRRIVVRFRENRDAWEVDFRDHGGKRHRPLFVTEEQALAHAAEVSRTLTQAVPLVNDPEITLSSYVARWLEGAQEIEGKTLGSYRHLLNMHVLPILGNLKLRELHRRHVKALLASKRAERLQRTQKQARAGIETPKTGYAKNTVRLIKAALSTVLSDAADDGYIATNPAFSAGRKRGKRAEALTQSERLQRIRPFSWDGRDTFLATSVPDRRHHALFAVMAKAGLRPGEAMGLKPEDLDFKALTVHVERSVTDDGKIKDCKTHEVRTVDLTPELSVALKRHVTWLKEEGLRTGSKEPQWMFLREDGSLMNKDYCLAVFRRVLKAAGLPHHVPYDLRHTYSCLLLAEGAPVNYVSEQLGHSNPATTLRYYAKWMPNRERRWVNLLDGRTASSRGLTSDDDLRAAELGADILEPKTGAMAKHR